MSNDAEWDDLAKELADDKPMVMYEITGDMDVKDHLVFHQGISAQRLKYLKEAAKVMKSLTMGNVDDALAQAKEFIDAWGDDDE